MCRLGLPLDVLIYQTGSRCRAARETEREELHEPRKRALGSRASWRRRRSGHGPSRWCRRFTSDSLSCLASKSRRRWDESRLGAGDFGLKSERSTSRVSLLCSEDFCQRHHGSPGALLRSQSQVVLCVGAAKLGDSSGFVWDLVRCDLSAVSAARLGRSSQETVWMRAKCVGGRSTIE